MAADLVYALLEIDTSRQDKYVASESPGLEELGWRKAKRRREGRPTPCFTNVVDGEEAQWIDPLD